MNYHFYNNKTFSDIKFKINDDIIYCHKVMLSARSNYFKSMFINNFSENRDEIVIGDNELLILIKLCYDCFNTINSIDEFEILMRSMDKYIIKDYYFPKLESIILNFIMHCPLPYLKQHDIIKYYVKKYLNPNKFIFFYKPEDIILGLNLMYNDFLENSTDYCNYSNIYSMFYKIRTTDENIINKQISSVLKLNFDETPHQIFDGWIQRNKSEITNYTDIIQISNRHKILEFFWKLRENVTILPPYYEIKLNSNNVYQINNLSLNINEHQRKLKITYENKDRSSYYLELNGEYEYELNRHSSEIYFDEKLLLWKQNSIIFKIYQ